MFGNGNSPMDTLALRETLTLTNGSSPYGRGPLVASVHGRSVGGGFGAVRVNYLNLLGRCRVVGLC